jgi:hypothetical protein
MQNRDDQRIKRTFSFSVVQNVMWTRYIERDELRACRAATRQPGICSALICTCHIWCIARPQNVRRLAEPIQGQSQDRDPSVPGQQDIVSEHKIVQQVLDDHLPFFES